MPFSCFTFLNHPHRPRHTAHTRVGVTYYHPSLERAPTRAAASAALRSPPDTGPLGNTAHREQGVPYVLPETRPVRFSVALKKPGTARVLRCGTRAKEKTIEVCVPGRPGGGRGPRRPGRRGRRGSAGGPDFPCLLNYALFLQGVHDTQFKMLNLKIRKSFD